MVEKCDLSAYKDSKQLTPKQREALYISCKPYTDAFHASIPNLSSPSPSGRGSGWGLFTSTWRAFAEEIDAVGIVAAINLACRRGIGELLKTYYLTSLRDQLLSSDFGEDVLAVTLYDTLFSQSTTEHTVLERQCINNSYAYIPWLVRDGNHTFGLDVDLHIPVVTIIKGDQKNPLISVASIVAKVERDAYMQQVSEHFPNYRFHKHKGYGSKLHRDSIATHGLSPLHRASYCSKIALSTSPVIASTKQSIPVISRTLPVIDYLSHVTKPSLLLHICCAPDLSRLFVWV
jgi:ribonuclease HII